MAPQSTLSFFFFLALVFSLLSATRAYFIIEQPSASSNWANGSPYPVTWTKGQLDGIGTFALEIIRISSNGLYYVAQNVPPTSTTLNILLENVPEGDDYFVVCLDSTDGSIFSVSSRFSVTNSSLAHANPNPDSSAPTATVTGPPNPLTPFATTLGPSIAANAGDSLILGFRSSPNTQVLGFGGILVLCSALLGAVMTLW